MANSTAANAIRQRLFCEAALIPCKQHIGDGEQTLE